MRRSRTCQTLDRFVVEFIVLTAFAVFATTGYSQENLVTEEAPPVAATSDLTVENVQGRLKKLDENKELDPAIKTKLTDLYSKTLEQLRAAAESTARSEQYTKLIREAPASLQALKTELATPKPEQVPDVSKDATVPEVQQLQAQAEASLSDAQKALQSLQDEPQRRANRRLEIPKLADSVKAQLQEIDKLLETKPLPDEAVDVSMATRMQLEARKKALTAESAANQLELQFFEATGELLAMQRDRSARRVAEAERQAKELRTLVNERRRQEADRQALEARKTSVQAHPVVRTIAEANAELAKRRQSIVDKIEDTTRELERTEQQVTALDERFKKITKRFETAGGTEAIGLLLRKQRDELPNTAEHDRRIKLRAKEIPDTYLELIDDEEKRNELATPDQRVKTIVAAAKLTVDESEQAEFTAFLEEEVRRVLDAQRAVYDSLIADTNSYLDKLVELDTQERQLLAKADELAKYCDERILWIRSTTFFGRPHLKQLGASIVWLGNADGWGEIGEVLKSEALQHTALTVISAFMFFGLVFARRRLRQTIAVLGEQAARSNNISYGPTFRVLVITGMMALMWPALIGYIGQRLISTEITSDEFASAFGHGLRATAIVFATLEVFRQVCRRHGLGEAHFDWDETAMQSVRVISWWFIACGLPLILIVNLTEAQSSENIKNSLGRLAFLCSLTVLTVCSHYLTRPVGGALERAYAAAPQAWYSRMQRTLYVLSIGAPITLGVLALSGYYYTALQLAWRLLESLWVILGMWIIYAALIRWSLLSYRDLAMRKNRERRAAEAAAAAATTGGPQPAGATIVKIQEVKLSDINKQTRKSFQLALAVGLFAGLWLVWIDVLPALGALRHVDLWMVEATRTVGDSTATVLQPVTLANVLLAIMIVALTFAAGRNLPSLLEITVLQRLPLDPSVRYAITTVCQYAITAVGLVSAFGTIGIGWSKVQWLVAAISVGLGFGLQEIFANFVSGLILLVERPVRLGDIVTVDNVTGHITRIQMRATTITDWDMRELVVPNKEFITGRVMNWTLSSTVARMSIVVGVAYGTDPDLVRGLLLKVAQRNPNVLKEPAPHALFDNFGDSTLNFILRVYMVSMDVYIQVRHSLHTDIANEFEQMGIEIAFPQRDIHIRSGKLPTATGSASASIADRNGA